MAAARLKRAKRSSAKLNGAQRRSTTILRLLRTSSFAASRVRHLIWRTFGLKEARQR
jgi:hypothetical protein